MHGYRCLGEGAAGSSSGGSQAPAGRGSIHGPQGRANKAGQTGQADETDKHNLTTWQHKREEAAPRADDCSVDGLPSVETGFSAISYNGLIPALDSAR